MIVEELSIGDQAFSFAYTPTGFAIWFDVQGLDLAGLLGLWSWLHFLGEDRVADLAACRVAFLNDAAILYAVFEVADADYFALFLIRFEIAALPKAKRWPCFDNATTGFGARAIVGNYGAWLGDIFGARAIGFSLPTHEIAAIVETGALALIGQEFCARGKGQRLSGTMTKQDNAQSQQQAWKYDGWV